MICIKRYILIVLCLVSFLCGCASTKIASYKAQSIQADHFTCILVMAKPSNLEGRQQIESLMARDFRNAGVHAIEGAQLFPESGNLCEDEKLSVMADNGIDAYMEVTLGKSGGEEERVYSTGTGIRIGAAQIWTKVLTKLFEVSTGEQVWEADSHTEGKAVFAFNSILNDYSRKVVAQLFVDGLIIKPK